LGIKLFAFGWTSDSLLLMLIFDTIGVLRTYSYILKNNAVYLNIVLSLYSSFLFGCGKGSFSFGGMGDKDFLLGSAAHDKLWLSTYIVAAFMVYTDLI